MKASSHGLAQRLIRALLLPLALAWIVAALGSAWYVRTEVARTLDAALSESAQRLLEISSHALAERKVPLDGLTLSSGPSPLPSQPIIENDDLMYQVVSLRGHVLIRSVGAPAQAMSVTSVSGFLDTDDLRVYTLKHPTLPVRIHIGAPLAYRRNVQLTAMLWGMLPLLGFPLVAWIVRQVCRRELAGVRDLAQEIRERTEHNLRPVTLNALPQELASVAESTNFLMQRLGDALDAERALAAHAAHELRTPLTIVRLRLQNVLSQPLSDVAGEEVRSAIGALEQLSRRTEKLLQLSRAEAGAVMAREAVNLGLLAAAVAQDFWADAGLLTRLQLSVPDDEDILAQGDFDALAIALRNLVENALRHGRGCQVTIEVERPATIRVTDDGPGISQAHIELLRRRVRHVPEAAGNGLGMSIVSTLMARHRGELVLVSQPPGKADGLQASLVLQAHVLVSPPPGKAHRLQASLMLQAHIPVADAAAGAPG